MFEGYMQVNKTHSQGYFLKDEIIPVVKYKNENHYRMLRPNGITCLILNSYINKIFNKNGEIINE